MKSSPYKNPKTLAALCGFLSLSHIALAQNDSEEVFELSPFTIDASEDEGYYASQTMAGGRLSGSLKDSGAAIQVITKEFMDDLGATGIDELLQYTTSSEVAGILGNFTGASQGVTGETSTGGARRDPDGTARIRGLASPDKTRNFFITDIPFDSYNTERLDINRGANSFLFGLGSPAGLINNGMAQARFKDSNEISTRIGSGGKDPSYRTSFGINRVILEDKLALRVNGLMDRTQYRQRPTFKDDDRVYTAITYRPFGDTNTVLRGHMERGQVNGNAPDVLLPQQNLSTFLDQPARFNSTHFVRSRYNQEGPNEKQFNKDFSDEEQQAYFDAGYILRNAGGDDVYGGIGWSGGAYGLVFDGTNGREAAFPYTDQYSGSTIDRDPGKKDPDEVFNYWSAYGGKNSGSPQGIYAENLENIKGIGWLDQGFTNLDNMDFSRINLGWDNDFYSRDFFNYNFSLAHTFWEGKGGFEVAYDFQDQFRNSYTAFNAGNSQITFDTNETLLLPEDPNYVESGNYDPMVNPNFGRPVILTKAGRRINDDQRTAKRFTGFVKHDFADTLNSDFMGKMLGNHTLTILADEARHDETMVNYVANSFGDPDPALHIGNINARQTANGARNTSNLVYIGPAQLGALTDPNFSLGDFALTPADYDLRGEIDNTFQKLSWNLGPDSDNQSLIDNADRSNGNEQFVYGTYSPMEVPNKNYRLQQTTSSSLAANSQSKLLDNHLVVNMGYREDTIENYLNTEANLIGLDEVADLRPGFWNLEDGAYAKNKKSIFGYGGVVYWPKNLVPLPEAVNDITLHYNESQNFIPATDRVDQYRAPLASPTGGSKDYGVSFYMFENKFVARLNWYDASLNDATAGVSGTFNGSTNRIFDFWGDLNRKISELDEDNDGLIDQDEIDQNITIDPETGLDEEFELPLDEAVAAMWPHLQDAKEARDIVAPYLNDQRLIDAFNVRFLPNGDIKRQSAGNITDTQDITSKGMEAEFIINPTKSWRIAFNAAKQQVILNNVAPRLEKLLGDVWIPILRDYGHLDWGNPVQYNDGDTLSDKINEELLEFYSVKGREGQPTAEQREWRFNLVTNYSFREGALKGFSIGGAARWQDEAAGGYPFYINEDGFVIPIVDSPFFTNTDLALDLSFGYRKKIFGNVDWRMQVNLKNVHNWDNEDIDITRFQPDGTAARARYAPPRTIYLTNSFKF